MRKKGADPLVPLLRVLEDVFAWLNVARVSGVVIGGVAASLLGRPRLTHDVDVLVSLREQEWPRLLAAGARFGLVARVKDIFDFAHRSRVLLMRHTPSGIDVDVVLGGLAFEEGVIARARWTKVGGVRLALPAPEDLVVMKAVAHRARDIADIEALLDVNPRLDLTVVRRWVREFSRAAEDPEMLAELERVVAKRRKKPAVKRKAASRARRGQRPRRSSPRPRRS